jgi:hypothetical protein
MEGQELKYCTYAKFPGIVGLVYGWFLVGISETPHFGGYSQDFASQGCTLLLMELDAPLPHRFRFKPRKAKEIALFKNGEVKWMSQSTPRMK